MHALTGKQITRLMRKHGQTIAGLAKSMQIAHREVRRKGVKGRGYVMDWLQAITGDPKYLVHP